MIWDLHCHLAGFAGRTPHERMAGMIEFANRFQIDRLCVYMGLSFLTDPSVDDMRRQNDEVLAAISHWHHRAFGFAYLNPKHVDASLEELERCVAKGPMVGVKLWVAERCSADTLRPIVARAEELNAVLFQHTWIKSGNRNLPGESTPAELVTLARQFPKAKIICGHTGGNWELGIRTVRELPHVSVDLAGSDPTSGMVEMAVRELGAGRVIYGSDVGGRSFASQLAKVRGAEIANEDKTKILGQNLKTLLLPILRAKGIDS
ncbi:MAG: amidohydrolase family protein [Planctomycetota bacterium]